MSTRINRRLDFEATSPGDSFEMDPLAEMDQLNRTQQLFPRLLQLCEQLPTQESLSSIARFLKYMQSRDIKWPSQQLFTALFYLAPITANHTPLEQLESLLTSIEELHLLPHQKALLFEIPSLLLNSLLESYEHALTSEEWNTLFSHCVKTQSVSLNFEQLLRLWPADHQVPALMEWLELAEHTPLYFETLNALCEKHPQILKKALFEGPTPHLFERLVTESEISLVRDFSNHFHPYLNDEGFAILLKQEDPLLHSLALSFLKNHLNEELPDFPDLGLSELSSALATGNLTLAIELTDCGVSLHDANLGEVEGLNLFYNWQREHLDQPFTIAPLYRLIISEGLSVEPLFELITLQIERATSPKECIRLTAELVLFARNVQGIDIFERITLLLAKWHRKDLSSYARMIPELKKHFNTPLLLLPLTSLGYTDGMVELNRNESLAYPFRELFPQALKSQRLCLSPQGIAQLQKECPGVMFDLLSTKAAETPTLRARIFALYTRSPTLQAYCIHTHLSHLFYNESLHPSKRDPLDRFLCQFSGQEVSRIFGFCVQQNHWSLATRVREFLEEKWPDCSEWKSIQSAAVNKSTPLTALDFQAMLRYIEKYREGELLQPLLEKVSEIEEPIKAQFQTILLSSTDSLLTFMEPRELCQMAFSSSFHEVAKKADPDRSKELAKRAFFETPVQDVIEDLESILENSTEETLPHLIEYFTPYFDRTEFLPRQDIKSLRHALAKWAPPLLWNHWDQTPLSEFHANMSTLRTLKKGLTQITERDLRPIFEERPFSNFTSYLMRFDRRDVEPILIDALRQLVTIVTPSALLETVLELNYQKVAVHILDRYFDQIPAEMIDHICKDNSATPLSHLLSIKELTAENYVKHVVRHHPLTRHLNLNWDVLKLGIAHGVQENFKGNFNETPFSNTSIGCGFENNRKGGTWEAAHKLTIQSLQSALGEEGTIFVQEMLQLMQNPTAKLFQQIPIKPMYEYVMGEIDRATFESRFNLFDLARYSKVFLFLDILKESVSRDL